MLQSTVKNAMSLGSAGTVLYGLHSFYNSVVRRASGTDIKVGCFVQQATAENEVVMASGKAITKPIVGVVVKDKLINSNVNTDIVKDGSDITVCNEGTILISVAGSSVEEGKYVFLKDSDGSLAFDSNKTKADHTFTGFKVDIGNTPEVITKATKGRVLIKGIDTGASTVDAFTITINGTLVNTSSLNFTSVTDGEDLASVINGLSEITCEYSSASNGTLIIETATSGLAVLTAITLKAGASDIGTVGTPINGANAVVSDNGVIAISTAGIK